MHKNGDILKLAVAALSAAAFLCCAKEPAGRSGDDSAGIRLKFSSESPSTRTFWNGSEVLWSEGDRIAVTLTSGGNWSEEGFVQSDALPSDCEFAEFAVPLSASMTAGGGSETMRFYAICPPSCAASGLSAAAGPLLKVMLPSEQNPSDGSFDRSADILSASSQKTYTAIPADAVPLLWNRAVAHLALKLGAPPVAGGETLRSLVLTADENAAIAGEFSLDLSSGQLTEASGDGAHNRITLNNPCISDSGDIYILVCAAPGRLRSLEIKIVTDEAEYTRTLDSEFNLLKDRRHTLSVDMSAATRTPLRDPGKEAAVNARIFKLLNLDRSGLEAVRSAYEDNRLYDAATALKEYWATQRGDIVNPSVNLASAVSPSVSEMNIADQALKENGYRFYVKNYSEGADPSTGLPRFYSFLDGDGGIDWTLSPTTESEFALQKHRHQWIDSQARAYNATGDEKYVRSIMEVCSDWLKTYPCPGAETSDYAIPDGGSRYSDGTTLKNLWTDLQAASRLTAYISALERCIGAECLTADFLTHLLVSFYDLTESILANPYHTTASNHRLYEIQAVYSAAVLLPEFAAAQSWERQALSDITEQCAVQFAADGVQNETDPSYHISVTALFCDIFDIALANGRQTPLTETDRLLSACRFVRDIVIPDYSVDDFNDTRSTSWTKSVLKRNFARYAGMFPSDGTFLHLATEGAQGDAPDEKFSAYPSSGWYMFRSGWKKSDMMLILKNNFNADNWWHCQPDNGTVSLYRNGRHFLPDAGVYTYGGSSADNAVRDEFRATAMHNTLTYGGATIADGSMQGRLVGEARTDVYNAVRTVNQSYPALSHERSVFHIKDGDFFVIADAALGEASGDDVALHWHFCPPEEDGGSIMSYSRETLSFSAATTFSDGNNMLFKTFVFNGLEASADWSATTGSSWTSSKIGQKTARDCCGISQSKTSNAPVRFITVILPATASAAAQSAAFQYPEISAVWTTATSIKVKVDDRTYNLNLPTAE